MPHKHKRRAGDAPDFDLPPTSRAAPLPVGKGKTANTSAKTKKRKLAHVEGYGQDDTPKAFQRLMAFSQAGVGANKKRSALDDGLVLSKKQKAAAKRAAQQAANPDADSDDDKKPSMTKANATAAAKQIPKIQPGESMAEYSARVDAALPLAGIVKTGKKLAGAPDHRVTKHEKRLKKLQAGWREEEARIRDKEAEEAELAEEERDEQALIWEDKSEEPAQPGLRANGKKPKAAKRQKLVGEVDGHSEDEWEALARKREQRKGLHDVVSAPPTFTKVPREIFKVKNGAKVVVNNVPNAVGSLRKREELGAERKTIIDTYRELMAAKKQDANANANSKSKS
ncbi:hypothetical protein C7974DRAFT_384686 [Boeremia exigua]|uniref:uncharacterized protein n=1 Tax=Boeremia exigua TaxID=749465 RepID=UPI001E8EDC19|nr:uncharacterized protein C7974DRAFT_384686 [Boeremia exigua]KAH6642023.1 hypothetical protein C7974DRAFT_384686 [Boeremia exigua]